MMTFRISHFIDGQTAVTKIMLSSSNTNNYENNLRYQAFLSFNYWMESNLPISLKKTFLNGLMMRWLTFCLFSSSLLCLSAFYHSGGPSWSREPHERLWSSSSLPRSSSLHRISTSRTVHGVDGQLRWRFLPFWSSFIGFGCYVLSVELGKP